MKFMNRDKLEQLTREIGQDNIPTLLGIFTGELVTYQTQLSKGDLAEKMTYMKEICHALKSSAASFGAESLCEFAIDIDAQVKGGKLQEDQSKVDRMLENLSETHTCYLEFLESIK
ncbi:Phosphorelay protein LuxU [Vibrio thalassae]|uniref:Phosphorelay protein LuxU n=1 Tax=Vibrio thalassae TaxID=1243014 RepID=A0A240EK88_9VIBR|nr:quorum-sensing phosphorelay protein LuxU [Vibrio thalassae]SNX48589.1 Phosphorelay protein LuxU [Vibrio thalassae]